MEIRPEDIGTISTIGYLFDDEVKMILTKGGLHVFIGKKKKNQKKAEIIIAASHKAIGTHQMEKQFGSDFKPILAKSEKDQLPKVEEKTSYLPSNAINNGLELYTLSKNNEIEFVLSKHGLTLMEYKAEANQGALVITNCNVKNTLLDKGVNKEVASSVARAMREKAYELNLSEIKR